MEPWVRYAHWVALALWTSALLAISARRARGLPDLARLYRWWAAPAAFLTFFSLIALLHAAPTRLLQRPVQLELVALIGLGGLDHLCERPARTRRLARLTAAGVVLLGAAVAAADVHTWGAA